MTAAILIGLAILLLVHIVVGGPVVSGKVDLPCDPLPLLTRDVRPVTKPRATSGSFGAVAHVVHDDQLSDTRTLSQLVDRD